MIEKVLSTKEVSRALGVKVTTLSQALWQDRFPAPEKIAGRYLWTAKDIDRASRYLLNKPYKSEVTLA